MGNLKKMVFGERMPDKHDPQYRERYEKDVQAGRDFAKLTRIDRLVGHIQKFASKHSILFLSIVLAIVFGLFVLNVYHFSQAYQQRQAQKEAVMNEGKRVLERLEDAHTMIPIPQEDGTDKEN
jgi:hypothetical protein